jgi:hypothetical protein
MLQHLGTQKGPKIWQLQQCRKDKILLTKKMGYSSANMAEWEISELVQDVFIDKSSD